MLKQLFRAFRVRHPNNDLYPDFIESIRLFIITILNIGYFSAYVVTLGILVSTYWIHLKSFFFCLPLYRWGLCEIPGFLVISHRIYQIFVCTGITWRSCENICFWSPSLETLIWCNWDRSQDSVFLTSLPNNSDTFSPYSHFEKHQPIVWSLTKNGKFMDLKLSWELSVTANCFFFFNLGRFILERFLSRNILNPFFKNPYTICLSCGWHS